MRYVADSFPIGFSSSSYIDFYPVVDTDTGDIVALFRYEDDAEYCAGMLNAANTAYSQESELI